MSHFEIAVTVYSVLSTIGLALTVYFGRKFLLGIEQRLHEELFAESYRITGELTRVGGTLWAHVGAHIAETRDALHIRLNIAEHSIKGDVARVEKWITDHAEELKARAEDLRVRALDLHDKTAASDTRQPPVR